MMRSTIPTSLVILTFILIHVHAARLRGNPCDYLDCQNGGVCRVKGGEAVCKCPRNFQGTECEEIKYMNPCDRYVCFNGATCELDDFTPVCACPDGFRGKRCDRKSDDEYSCLNYRCPVGSQCIKLKGLPFCLELGPAHNPFPIDNPNTNPKSTFTPTTKTTTKTTFKPTNNTTPKSTSTTTGKTTPNLTPPPNPEEDICDEDEKTTFKSTRKTTPTTTLTPDLYYYDQVLLGLNP